MQIGSAEYDGATDVAIDSRDNVYVAGTTWGSLRGPNAGNSDAWIAKLVPQAQPGGASGARAARSSPRPRASRGSGRLDRALAIGAGRGRDLDPGPVLSGASRRISGTPGATGRGDGS